MQSKARTQPNGVFPRGCQRSRRESISDFTRHLATSQLSHKYTTHCRSICTHPAKMTDLSARHDIPDAPDHKLYITDTRQEKKKKKKSVTEPKQSDVGAFSTRLCLFNIWCTLCYISDQLVFVQLWGWGGLDGGALEGSINHNFIWLTASMWLLLFFALSHPETM